MDTNKSYRRKSESEAGYSLKYIQKIFFRIQLVLIISLAAILGIAGTLINLHYENEKRDRNLQNVAEAIASSPILTEYDLNDISRSEDFANYLDTLRDTLDDIDVISIVTKENLRIYHSNHSLIGTMYDGTRPEFDSEHERYYTVDETGPSGSQRRAYAAIYDKDGTYTGVVMAIMLMKNIKLETFQMFFLFFMITLVAILIELIVAGELSGIIKQSLMGYEPDVFTAMYRMRDNILETLEEGILAVDKYHLIQYANKSALEMLGVDTTQSYAGKSIDVFGDKILSDAIKTGEKAFNITIENPDILLERVPILEYGENIGTIAILHNRAEYTKLMEDLSGTRFLVDSMRANNHDFTNKLHVILGLIQMEMYEEAISYIQNITIVQRETISKVMHAIHEPSVAALLIGKIARASELNVQFVLQEGSCYATSDLHLPSEMLITVIGNLLDNAFESMNETSDFNTQKELLFGIYSRPGAVLITVDDTGNGIEETLLDKIFENGFSTKGEGRGTGLYQVKNLIESYHGKISIESQSGIGTSFSISFTGQ